jgi:hypothetical protein
MQLLVAVGVSSVTARPEAQSAAVPTAAPAAAPTPASRQHASRAKVVLIGALAHDRDLAALLHELLGADGIQLQIVGADRFEPGALFGDDDSDDVTLVFVGLRDARDARLHFRAQSGERFLLRRLELPSGVDAVGRELLGQVVKSSVSVLLHSPEGLSRAEATAALARDAPPEPPPPASENPVPPSASHTSSREGPIAVKSEPVPPLHVREEAWRLAVSAGYSVEWSGSDLSLAHGPGAALGARRATTPHWGAKLAVQRLFTQRVRTPLIHADVQRTDTQILLELGFPLANGQFGVLALGPSLEISHLEPTFGATGVAIAAAKTDLAPAFRAEARYELAFGSVVFGASAFSNLSLARTHYDFVDEGVRQRVATLGSVRPGGALMLGLR